MRLLVSHARPFLAAGFGLVAFAGIASIYLASRTAELERWAAHTLQVQDRALNLLNDLNEAEGGQRGFLLAGDEEYLNPLKQAQAELPQAIADLRQLTSDSPEQQETLKQIEALSTARVEGLLSAAALAKEGHREEAIAAIRTGRDKQLMDSLRAHFKQLYNRERDFLVARQAASATSGLLLELAIGASLALALAFAAILADTVRHGINKLQARTAELEAEAKRRRETEDMLRQAQKLEAVGQLTGGIAHDFNNLLTVILGNLDTLRRRLENGSSSQGQGKLISLLSKPLDSAIQGARNAAQLTHRLLAVARQQPLQPVQLDLNQLAAGMSDLLRRTLGEKINLETVLAGGLWPTFADANQVENVLVNLCVNARDAMPEGGKLTIETANSYLDESYTSQFSEVKPGPYVLLSVTDTGTGIPPDIMPHIFEPFFTTKPAGLGSGLGLAMVYGFVKQSGGHIRIYSEAGHGTTVKIYLPRLMAAQERQAAPAAAPAGLAAVPLAAPGETILLVEDNHGVRDYGRAALEELGYSVIEAGDAAVALNVLQGASRIDLLFTDIVLPGMGGRELAAKAAKLRRGLPVLFTTGYTRNAIVHQGKLDSGVHLLTKPYTQPQLAKKIRELLDGRPPLQKSP